MLLDHSQKALTPNTKPRVVSIMVYAANECLPNNEQPLFPRPTAVHVRDTKTHCSRLQVPHGPSLVKKVKERAYDPVHTAERPGAPPWALPLAKAVSYTAPVPAGALAHRAAVIMILRRDGDRHISRTEQILKHSWVENRATPIGQAQ